MKPNSLYPSFATFKADNPKIVRGRFLYYIGYLVGASCVYFFLGILILVAFSITRGASKKPYRYDPRYRKVIKEKWWGEEIEYHER
jgi:hypothetical protein